MSISPAPKIFAATGADELLGGVFGVLPHEQGVFVPGEVQAGGGNAVDVFDGRIDIQVVIVRALGGRLAIEADAGGVAAFDFALEVAAEAGDGVEIAGEAGAATIGVDGIAANEFFFVRVGEVLPAGEPGDGAFGNVIGEAGLTEQLREVTAGGGAVEMVAEIAARLAAGIGDAGEWRDLR